VDLLVVRFSVEFTSDGGIIGLELVEEAGQVLDGALPGGEGANQAGRGGGLRNGRGGRAYRRGRA
jgi:hypothetical protein